MSWTIDQTFVKQFTTAVYDLPQQGESKLRSCVSMAERVVGTRQFQERLGFWNPQRAGVRHGVTPLISSDWSKRALDVTDWEGGEMFDKLDKLKALVDPANPVTTAMRKGFNRRIDQTIIDSFKSTVVTQADEAGTAAFPAGNTIAVDMESAGTNTGLTLAKLKRAAFKLNDNHVPDTDRYIAVSAKGLEQILAEDKVVNFFYNVYKPLMDGQVVQYLGFEWKMFGSGNTASGPTLPISTNTRSCFAWQKDSMRLGFGEEMRVEAGPNMERKGNWTVYTAMSLGSVRMDEVGVVEILIDETK